MARRDAAGRQERRRLIESYLAEREATGESYRELSERSGIPAPTLASWRKRLAAEVEQSDDDIELVEVEPGSVLGSAVSMVEVVVPIGMVVRAPHDSDVDMVADLVAAVVARC